MMSGLGLSHRHPNRNPLNTQWRSFFAFIGFIFLLALMSCGMVQNSIEAKRAGSEITTVSKVTPIVAKPNEVVKLTGTNFYETKNLKVSLDLTNGETASVPLAISDSKSASFTMPDGAGLGVKQLKLTQGTSAIEVGKFNLIADQADNQLPILITESTNVCGGVRYIDRNGDIQTGTKNCAAAEATPKCTADAQVQCIVDGNGFVAASLVNLQASNIKSGVIIGGVQGTVQEAPAACLNDGSSNCVVDGTTFKAAKLSNISSADLQIGKTIAGISGSASPRPQDCSGNGQQSCVATGTYFAGTACGVDGSNCFLPAYSIPGLQTKKAIDFATIDSSKMLDSLTVSGVTGTVTSRGSWNLTSAFPGSGYYTGVSNLPSASTIASGTTITGVPGSAALKPADCAFDGATGCVAVATYPAALASGAASKILSGQTLGGVPGNVTLPAVGKVLTGTTFGVSGTDSTGTLTIPAASNVLATAPAYGDAAALTTPTLPAQGTWNVTSSFPGAGYYAGVSNTPAATSYTGTLFGTAGTATLEAHSNCAADGATGCVAVASYPAALATGAASKILSGQTLAGVAGNVTLPAVGKVLTGTTFGVSGTGSAGTLTIPAAANVLATAPAYGDAAALTTPTLPSQGTWNVTNTFPGAGYYAGVSNTPAATSYTGTLFGTAGTATLESHSNCAADGATGCVAVATYPAALAIGAASKILSGQTLAGVAGNVILPAVGKVLTGTTYGVGGTGSTGTLILPTASDVLSGSGTYGDPGAAVTPTLANKGSWDLTTSFPGAGYYSGTTNTPAASIIASGNTLIGIPGSATLSPANCSSNGQQSCVATGTYFAGTACSANGSGCYVPSYVTTTQPLKAISYDAINSSAGNIRSSTTLGGVTGTLADCSADGGLGCVVVGPSYAAAATTGAASKILSGQTLAGVSGNVTLPAVGKVLTGTTFGVSGTGSTGTLTIPAASNVLATAPAYGDASALTTPTLANKGSWDLATSFPGAGYYSGTTNTPASPIIASGNTIVGVAGSATLSPVNCSSNGQQSCVATGTYFAGTACSADGSGCYLPSYVATTQPLKAISYDTINSSAASIRSSVTLGGVTGTLADCSNSGSLGCVTAGVYKSADFSNITVGNIKSGVTLAGVTGQYPSVTYPMDGSNGADLTSATFNAQIKSSGTFQYFGSDGTRYTGAGDTNITANKIANGVSIFGTTGTWGAAPDPWNVRVGATVNGVTGKLRTTCRNRANLNIFDIDAGQSATITTGSPGTINIAGHGLANGTTIRFNYSSTPTGLSTATTYYVINAATDTFQVATTLNGTGVNITAAGANVTVHKFQATPASADIWDTIDDYNNGNSGLPPTLINGWTTNTDCGGVEITSGDDNVWKDVTTTDGVTASDCSTTPANCTMKDKISGLSWTKPQTAGVWWQAVTQCNGLTYNGQAGWRVPTQKELIEAYSHGVRSVPSSYPAAATNWIAEGSMNLYFASGTTNSYYTDTAFAVNLAYGYTGLFFVPNPGARGLKYSLSVQVVCVK